MMRSRIRPDLLQSRIPRSLSGAVCTALLLAMPIIAADVKQTAGPNQVDSPSFGYVVRTPADGSLELRAILGIPGAARFSDPIALPDGTFSAEPAPGQGWVLAIRSNEAVAFLPTSGATTSIARIGTPSAWAFSPSGSRLALFYPDRGNVLLMSGLPANPKLESTVRVAQLDSFAISDNGILAYSADHKILNSGGGLIFNAAGPFTFEPGRDSLILFDGVNSNLLEVAAAGAATRVIAGGITAPDQILAGTDAIFLGNTSAGTVSLVAYSDGSISTRSVSVSRFLSTSIAGTVLVSSDTDQPTWLVNAQGVSFVPAIVTQSVQ